ncbi:MAG: GTPase [Planctomycetota bacterium]|jgi:ribosome-interacting GTPase 1
MPANLTPQYFKAQQRYRAASEPREQLAALQEMLRVIPKHKGTEHLQADLKRKIKELRAELHARKKRRKGPSFAVDSGMYPQVVVLGPPNAGKSSLISGLTGTELEVAPYPYTTREPRPAMMPFENTKVQLVDTPPVFQDSMEPWLGSLARTGDAVLIVVDLAAGDLLEACEGMLAQLAGQKLYLGQLPAAQQEVVGAVAQPTLCAANKCDAPGAGDALEIFREVHGKRFAILPVSATTGEGLEELRRRVWALLDLVRAIPKPPGKLPDHDDPILLPRGSTVVDMARAIHGELAENLKRARVWGCADHAEGQWISRDHVVADGEIFELET